MLLPLQEYLDFDQSKINEHIHLLFYTTLEVCNDVFLPAKIMSGSIFFKLYSPSMINFKLLISFFNL